MASNKRLIAAGAAGAAGVTNTDNFDIVTYTGTNNSTSVSISSLDFQPDLIIHKVRNDSWSHWVYDSIRGTGGNAELQTNSTAAEGGSNLETYGSLGSFDSNGFTSAVGVNDGQYFNGLGKNFVAWCWKAASSDSTNTNGVTSGSVTAVTSTVRANQEAGFSICQFTTPSSGKPSWGHGLSQSPELIIVKQTDGTAPWFIYAPSILGQKELRFTLAAATPYTPDFISVDSSKIDLGSSSFNISGSAEYINYNFHSVDGYQKIDKFFGDGNTSQDITTGFQPRFVILKLTTSGHWFLFDSERPTGEGTSSTFLVNAATQELTNRDGVDFTSTGFTVYDGDNFNASGAETIYLAIA